MTMHTLLHLKCIRLVSVFSIILPCINMGVRIELTLKQTNPRLAKVTETQERNFVT